MSGSMIPMRERGTILILMILMPILSLFHSFTLFTSFHQQSENIEAQNKSHIGAYSSKELKYIEICTDSKGSFHGSGGTHSMPDNCSGTGLCLCESGTDENEIVSRTSMQQLPNEDHFVHKSPIHDAKKAKKSYERVKTNRRKDGVFPSYVNHEAFVHFQNDTKMVKMLFSEFMEKQNIFLPGF